MENFEVDLNKLKCGDKVLVVSKDDPELFGVYCFQRIDDDGDVRLRGMYVYHCISRDKFYLLNPKGLKIEKMWCNNKPRMVLLLGDSTNCIVWDSERRAFYSDIRYHYSTTPPRKTIEINGKKYNEQEVIERIKELKEID